MKKLERLSAGELPEPDIELALGKAYSESQVREIVVATRLKTIEECAVAAWNHYMDACSNPTSSLESWLASEAIRKLKE
jgi:hypothetical protein